MTIWIYTAGRPSHGAAQLAKSLGFRRFKPGRPVKSNDIFVNWGSKQQLPHFNWDAKTLNGVMAVVTASNKQSAFHSMTNAKVKCVPWCDGLDQDTVQKWAAEGSTIVGRQTLTGHSGHGIIIMEKGEPIQPALLYTKYIWKVREYRVHVVGMEVIDTQQKVRDPHKQPLSWKVRSHDNGFMFTRNTVAPSDVRDKLAVEACMALGLDFGAVDIVVDKHGVHYVLEVNTAPGLEGQTITNYATAFRKLADG